MYFTLLVERHFFQERRDDIQTNTFAATSGAEATIEESAIAELSAKIKGEVLTPTSAGYDEARTIWNAMIDKRPSLIVQCMDTYDVCKAVRFGRAHGLLVSVRGGGHNIAGNAVCDGGMMISLVKMREVDVDAESRTATVQGGATLGEFDAACQAHGLATPTGINSTTGIAGLTLGGGMGWLSRRYGLSIDNLLSVEMVTAEGDVIVASETQYADLFWGIRGGGGNFGIVTRFMFRLHKVGPEVLSGLIVHPIDDAKSLLQQYREVCKDMSDDLTVWVVMRKAPPLPFVPEDYHGKPVLIFAALYAGDMEAGAKEMAPLRSIGKPLADVIGPHPFAGWQAAFDPLLADGARNYWKSHEFDQLEDGFFDELIGAVDTLPSPHCEIFIAQMGGATSRVPSDSTAYGNRQINFVMNVHGRWESAEEDEAGIAWCRGLFDAVARFSTGGVYVNFLTSEESSRVQNAYGANYQRLVGLKRQYDPANFFRMNQNINPA